jgi:hypothetical protein
MRTILLVATTTMSVVVIIAPAHAGVARCVQCYPQRGDTTIV